LKIKTMQLVLLLVFIGMARASAQYSTHTANVPVGSGPVRSTSAPPGAISRTKPDSPDADAKATLDPREESVWRAAKQLELTSDQRTKFASALKAEKAQRADLDKALQDARSALANVLANGETFLGETFPNVEIENLTSANAKVQESDLKLGAGLYATLTSEQQKRLLSMSTPLSLATASHELARNQ